jgi:hypothetical protein
MVGDWCIMNCNGFRSDHGLVMVQSWNSNGAKKTTQNFCPESQCHADFQTRHLPKESKKHVCLNQLAQHFMDCLLETHEIRSSEHFSNVSTYPNSTEL